MAKAFQKFLLLMWKNVTLLRRHPIQTALEIFVPVALTGLLVAIRSAGLPYEYGAVLFLPFDNGLKSTRVYNLSLAFSPDNQYIKDIMNDTVNSMRARANATNMIIEHVGFKDSKSLESYLLTITEKEDEESANNRFYVGVQFDDYLAGQNGLDALVNVTIRYPAEISWSSWWDWSTDDLIPSFKQPGPREVYSNTGGSPGYHEEGFLSIQEEVSFSIINYLKKKDQQVEFDRSTSPIYMQRFPYPKYTEDFLITIYQYVLPMIIVISFIYTSISIVKLIAIEKERQLKETMKIMGLPGWLHWTAWFVTIFTILLISCVFIVVLLSIPWFPRSDYTVFTYSDPSFIFFFLLFYICASITFFFAVSVMFKKATTAAILAGVLWFLSYLPYTLIQTFYNTLNLGEKLATGLLSNSAMSLGFQLVLTFEGNGEGAQWSNIWTSASATDTLVMGHVLLMLLFDALLYLAIAVYIEAVFPGEFGVPQVWYFPFTKAYWCGKPVETDYDDYHDEAIHNQYYEEEPTNLEPGIKIQHLRKEYSNKTIAVKDLTLNIFKDQITVLLGHNGAGKTTTMSMLTGMFPPSSGTAVVGGYDIRKNIDKVRDSLGLCPQHNILFDELTVTEHLYFYCKLKGLDKSQINDEIPKYLQLLELVPKANASSSTLSGGMKRKLSVGVALCGGSSVVMCDEPSSGMDPAARRALWDFLQSQKKGRTILLTTHFMDEADVLGDRIAIMAEGELQCCGSSFFLKKKYGAGYHLIMDKSQRCNPNDVTSLLKKYIPDIQIESHIGSELRYLLYDNHSSVFKEMLSDLEINSDKLGINSYGISLTNLDEVFMKARADSKFENGTETERSTNGYQAVNLNSNSDLPDTSLNVGVHYLSGWALWRNQLMAMFMKRGLTTLRLWYQVIIQNVIAIVFLLSSFIVINSFGIDKDLPLLKIELDSYNDPVTAFSHSSNNKYVQEYKNFLASDGKEMLDWGDSNFQLSMIRETANNPSLVNSRYLVGATFWRNNSITAWFNNDPYHTPPLALQLAINSILRTELTPQHEIQINNHPLPFSRQRREDSASVGIEKGFNIAINAGIGMAIASSFFIMFYVRERFNRAKHLQYVSGVGVVPFWLASFIFDFILYLVTSCCLIIVFAVFEEEGYSNAEELGRVFLILLYFGYSVLPLNYLMSFRYDVPSTGYIRMVLFNIILGIAPFIVLHFMSYILEEAGLDGLFRVIFLFSPVFSFCSGIRDLDRVQTIMTTCDQYMEQCLNDGGTNDYCESRICVLNTDCCYVAGYFTFTAPGLGLTILMSLFAGTLYFLILLGKEYHFFESLRYRICKGRNPVPQTTNMPEDTDVLYEKEKLRSATMEELSRYSLSMRDVTKFYKKHLAVNQLSLGVNKNECFGLLGVNGAGKTTTFKMMTGDIKISYGDAWVNGISLKSSMKKVHQLIGYCPQFDALLEDLTCWETLIMFCLIRGIPLSEAKLLTEKLAREFDFYPHLRKRVKQLSGGNKRKLSTAVALIGEPQVLYLDEPTTGMDPATKRYLWKVLCKIRDQGTCIILTSHSMEECEALCTRLAVMVNGTFRCLGSTQHLKSKFAQGYTLTIKVKKMLGGLDEQNLHLSVIEKFVLDRLPGSILREKHESLLTFYIQNTSMRWSDMFGVMESGKQSLNIEDYSLGQCTLEQVFLAFTRNQY